VVQPLRRGDENPSEANATRSHLAKIRLELCGRVGVGVVL